MSKSPPIISGCSADNEVSPCRRMVRVSGRLGDGERPGTWRVVPAGVVRSIFGTLQSGLKSPSPRAIWTCLRYEGSCLGYNHLCDEGIGDYSSGEFFHAPPDFAEVSLRSLQPCCVYPLTIRWDTCKIGWSFVSRLCFRLVSSS